MGWAAIFLLRLPSWVRWIILLPALGLSALLLTITFNVTELLVFWSVGEKGQPHALLPVGWDFPQSGLPKLGLSD